MVPDGGVLKFGRFELDLARRELRRDGVPVDLQRAPLQLLLYLAEHRDRAVPKDEILTELWRGSAVTDSSVSNALSQLRIAVEDDGRSQRVIRTGRGRGYRFVAVPPAQDTAFRAAWPRWTSWLAATAALLLLAGLAAWWLSRARALPPIRSVAVLPLENLSGEPHEEYFADGMTDALISELAKIGSLRVISRPSVVRYKGTAKSALEIATELAVEALIVGSIVLEDMRIRINLQLVDGRSDAHVWSRSYERDLQGVLALQGEVAQAVATQMRVELIPDERSRLASSRTIEPEAYDAYMRAVALAGANNTTGVDVWGPKALEHLDRAVELDPDIAPAWAMLGQVYISLSARDFSVRDAPQKGREAVLRALELDDSFAPAHASLGHILRFLDWDFAAAERSFERAMLLAPFSPSFRMWYGDTLLLDGQCERALEEYERVRQLLSGWYGEGEAFCYAELGRFDESYRTWLRVFDAGGPRGAEAREVLERGWADGGWSGVWHAFIDASAETPHVNPMHIAMACSWVGEMDDAFAWLDRAYRARDPMITNLKTIFCSRLSSDPRYGEFVSRIGLPES